MSIQTDVRDGVLLVTLARPKKKNALSKAMMGRLSEVFSQLPDCGAVVLTGNRDIFTAGADLTEFTGSAEDASIEAGLADVVTAIESAPAPVIAAISGPCFGAGVELSAACDMRFATQQSQFEIPATRLGILYRPDGIERLRTSFGGPLTKRLVLLNERVTAQDLAATGAVKITDDPLEAALSVASHATQLDSEVVAATKRYLNGGQADWQALRATFLAR